MNEIAPYPTTIYLMPQTESSDAELERQIDRAESEWLTAGNNRTPSQTGMIRRKASQIKESIRRMRAQGLSSNEISRTVNQSIQEMSQIVYGFREGCTSFQIGKVAVCDTLAATTDKISAITPYFPIFTPPQRSFDSEDSLHDSLRTYMDEKAMVRLVAAKSRPAQRPTYSQAKRAYTEVKEIWQLKEVVGGKLKQNFDSKSFINGCASRISYVLQQAGYKIPAIPGETVSGKNGEQYIFRLTELDKFMRKTFGTPDCEWRKGEVIGNLTGEKCSTLMGRKGILIERWRGGPHTTCTGHAQIISGKGWDSIAPQEGVFWELPDDGHGEDFNDTIQTNQEGTDLIYESNHYRFEERDHF